MTYALTIMKSVHVAVKYLKAECGVRYWEDGTVNDTEDTDGSLIPCRERDAWCPIIDLNTGAIADWPEGTTADIHYKVCDDGRYSLLNEDRNVVKEIDGYVPSMMSPGGSGYGDYVIMKIDGSGVIQDWNVDLSYFDEERS